MSEKEFQEIALQLITAAKKQVLMEFRTETQMINVKETDFETLLNLNLGRLRWLQEWGLQLQRSESELYEGTLSKQAAITLNNATQWTYYFEFASETQEDEFKNKLKV